jgi:predicted metal-binding membrane protein
MKSRTARRFALLELVAGREWLVALLMLLAFTSACWAWVVAMSRDMYGPMEGASAWMMTGAWDAKYLALMWAMWAAMMAAMMLPSASPTLLLFVRAARRRHEDLVAAHRVHALAAGYLVVWAVFSVAATMLQWLLASQALLSPIMTSASPRVTAAILFLAGVYQLTPLKQVCLQSCRSPLSFLLQQWQPGWTGAFRMGLQHGSYCLGCCWALMLLLFAGGVMHLGVILLLTGWILVEKLVPAGEMLVRISGVALMAAAVWMLLR